MAQLRTQSFLPPLLICVVLTGCAHEFPRPGGDCCDQTPGSAVTGPERFAATLKVHGGDALAELNDVAVALDGRWKQLIRRIQPLVTDFRYRVKSEERLLLRERAYASAYTGPDGSKWVWRRPPDTRVHYNAELDPAEDVWQSTALTADSFFIFSLGPLALADYQESFRWLGQRREKGRRYDLLYLELKPGLGESLRDEVVVWVDAESDRTFRVQITLEGFETTRGANVDVTYLDYRRVDAYLFPVRFFERVRAPIAINAHAWHTTGLDVNRGLEASDFDDPAWSERARRPAGPLPGFSN
ncbi:MAG: hypothetical protein AAF648_15270 [Pseudomonadota bacterium]